MTARQTRRTIIEGGDVVAFDGRGHRLLRNGVVVYEGATITAVAPSYSGDVDHRIDARGKLVCPGFINAHVHIGVEVMTSLLDVDRAGAGRWLSPSLAAVSVARPGPLRREAQRASAIFALSRLVRSGCTTVVDVVGSGTLWWLGNPPDDVQVMVDAVDAIGVRAYLSPGYRSHAVYADATGNTAYHPLPREGRDGLDRAVAFIQRNDGTQDGRLRGMLFPHATFNCTPELLRETRRAADALGVGIQIHTASRQSEVEMLRERYNWSPIQLLAEADCLMAGAILGHCVFLRGHSRVGGDATSDLRLIAGSGATVAHSPRVFARQGIALESFGRYLAAGIPIAMGTDIWPLDMVSEMRLASLVGKVVDGDPLTATAADVFTAATLGGARALGRSDLGRLTPGAKADLVLFKVAESPRIGPVADPVKGLIAAGTTDDVHTVIVDGRIVVENGRVVGFDEGQLRRDAEPVAAALRVALAERGWSGRPEVELFPPAFAEFHG
jgi:cytosine/adenosine deaminase-related metal-dependent hydrolase